MRILLVNGEYSRSEAMLRRLSFHGKFEAVAANDCDEAWNQLRENQFDVILTDNDMPLINGRTFVMAAKKEFPDLLIVLTRSEPFFPTLDDVEYFRGADARFPEPMLLDVLEAIISALVTQKKGKTNEKD